MVTILVIEDNDEVRENISEILQLSGYRVLNAANGKSGVEVAIAEKPDLIICDIMMPVLDGYGVLHLLNKREETNTIPFIFLTAKSEKMDFRKGMEMGADDYLTKPFDGIELLNAVESRINKTARIRKNFEINAGSINEFIRNAQKDTGLKMISEEREICEFKKKHLLYSSGQRPKSVFFVVSGKVKTYKINDDGKELITTIYCPNDFFGYTAILDETAYNDNAQILEDAELMLIPSEDFMALISADIQVSRQFIKMIAHNIESNEENLLNLAYNSLRKKVAYGIIQLFDKYRKQDPETSSIQMSRENMAYATGIAAESLIRTLGDFKAEKLIEIDGSKVIIINENKLRNLPY